MTTLRAGRAERRQIDGLVGLAIFLGATTMLFAALLLAYAVLRAQAIAWPPPGTPPFPKLAAGAIGGLLVAACLALRAARPRIALACGAAFLAAQVALWRHLVAARLGPGAGPLGDAFFALSGFHALHVAAGLVALAWTRARRPRLIALYWDFVLAVWLVVYAAVCLT
jgi:heme/copper-type cytochrome/quinol oxidase subunit 3